MDSNLLASKSVVQDQKILEHYLINADKTYKPKREKAPKFKVLKREFVNMFDQEIKTRTESLSRSSNSSARNSVSGKLVREPSIEISMSRNQSANERKKIFTQTSIADNSDSSKMASERSLSQKGETQPTQPTQSLQSLRSLKSFKKAIDPSMGNKSRATFTLDKNTKMNPFFKGAGLPPKPKVPDHFAKVRSLQSIDEQGSILSDLVSNKKMKIPHYSSSVPDLNSYEAASHAASAPIDEHHGQAEEIMLKCAMLYKDVDKVEKKISNAEKGYVRSLGDLLKRIKQPKIKWDYWKTDKEFLVQKERVAQEIQKLKAEKNGRVFDIDVYIKETFFPETLPQGYTPKQKNDPLTGAPVNPFAPNTVGKKKSFLTPLDRLALKMKDNSLNQMGTFQMTEAPDNYKSTGDLKSKDSNKILKTTDTWILSPRRPKENIFEKENAPHKAVSKNLISLYRKFNGNDAVTRVQEQNNFINNFTVTNGIEFPKKKNEKEPHLALKNKLTSMALNNPNLAFATRLSIIKQLGDRNTYDNRGDV